MRIFVSLYSNNISMNGRDIYGARRIVESNLASEFSLGPGARDDRCRSALWYGSYARAKSPDRVKLVVQN